MDTGLTRDGNVYLRVHTSSTFWIGKDEERLIAGDFLPQLHLDWEAWMRGLENEFPYLSRERSLSGSDLRRSF